MHKKTIESAIKEDGDLNAILDTLAPITVKISNQYKHNTKIIKKTIKNHKISAFITEELKREIAIYLLDHPKENERSLILKGLKALNFSVNNNDLIDGRIRKTEN